MIISLEKQVDALCEYAQADTHRIGTGLPTIDAIVGGPAPGEVALIVARSFAGKSIMAQNIILNNKNIPSIFYSMEMPAVQALIRLYAMWANVPSFQVQSAIENKQIPDNIYDLAEAFPYHRIVDTPSLSLAEMGQAIDIYREQLGKHPQVVIVDYAELIGGDKVDEARANMDNVMVELKNWAKEQSMRVYVVHQANRSEPMWEPPNEDSPRFAGHTQSDIMIGMWRPHRNPDMDEAQKRYYSNKIMFNVLKNRPYFELIDRVMYTITPSLRLLEGDVYSDTENIKASGEESRFDLDTLASAGISAVAVADATRPIPY